MSIGIQNLSAVKNALKLYQIMPVNNFVYPQFDLFFKLFCPDG